MYLSKHALVISAPGVLILTVVLAFWAAPTLHVDHGSPVFTTGAAKLQRLLTFKQSLEAPSVQSQSNERGYSPQVCSPATTLGLTYISHRDDEFHAVIQTPSTFSALFASRAPPFV